MSNPNPIESASHMTLTELLRQHLPPARTQKSIAMDFHDRLEKAGHTRLRSASYVESQFSRLLKGEVRAVRFFFGSREHAVALIATMEIPEPEHDAILRSADQVIQSNGEAPPRLAIDLTRWSNIGSTKALFDSVRALVIEPKQIEPAVLLVTESLFESVPRSFDNVPWLRIEVVDSAEVAAKVTEFIEEGALVASPSRHARPDRWLALDFDEQQGRLAFEPEDGFAQFARLGALSLPLVEYDLAKYVVDDLAQSFDATTLGPIEARRLMCQLGDDAEAERIDPDPRKRLAMANALGVVATATPRDRVEADLRSAIVGLGNVFVRAASTEELDQTLAKARRRPVTTGAMRVGDEIHVVNPDSTWSGLDHPRVKVHRIDAPEPWIVRLRAAVADWTLGDFEADPYLVRAMNTLDPDLRDTLPLLHARAWILNSSTLLPKPAVPIKEWRDALRTLLVDEIPLAMLIVARDKNVRETAFLSVPPTDRVASGMMLDSGTTDRLLHVPALVTAVPHDRSAPILLASTQQDMWGHRGSPTRLMLPIVPDGVDAARLDEQWLDAFEAFQAGTRFSGVAASTIDVKPVRESWPWDAADSLLANVWLALRAAVEHMPAVRSANGRVAMSLGAGLAVEINASATATDIGATRAALECSYSSTAAYLTGSVASGVDGVVYHLPLRLVLLGGRCRIQVRFVASPLLLGHSNPVGARLAMQAAHVAAEEEAEEAARRAADDDDD